MTSHSDNIAQQIADATKHAQAAYERQDIAAAKNVIATLMALNWTNAEGWTSAMVRDALEAVGVVWQMGDFGQPIDKFYLHALDLYAATGAGFSDKLVAWFNLQAVYGQRGDRERRNIAGANAAHLASDYSGPLTPRDFKLLLTLIDQYDVAAEPVMHLYHPLAAMAREDAQLSLSTRVTVLARYANSLTFNDRHAQAMAAFGDAAGLLDGVDEAAEAWRVPVLNGLGSAACLSGDIELAERSYEAAIAAVSDGAAAPEQLLETLYFNTAVLWLDNGRSDRFAQAQRLLADALALCGARTATHGAEYALGLVQQARLALAQARSDEAAGWFRQAVAAADTSAEADPRMPGLLAEASRRLAHTLFDAGSFQCASDAYFFAVRVDVQDAQRRRAA